MICRPGFFSVGLLLKEGAGTAALWIPVKVSARRTEVSASIYGQHWDCILCLPKKPNPAGWAMWTSSAGMVLHLHCRQHCQHPFESWIWFHHCSRAPFTGPSGWAWGKYNSIQTFTLNCAIPDRSLSESFGTCWLPKKQYYVTTTMLLQHVPVPSCPEDLKFSPVRWVSLVERLAGKQSYVASFRHITVLSPFPFASMALQSSCIITKMFE